MATRKQKQQTQQKQKPAETTDLYTPDDVRKVRELLIAEQNQLCGITGVPTAIRDFHLDHCHDSQQLVRSAANKHANMLLGKLENLELRYLKHWYPYSLSVFLRSVADYLDKPKDMRYRHPGFIAKLMTMFSKLKEPDKDKLLADLGYNAQPNAVKRKALFKKIVMQRQHGFLVLSQMIENMKG